MFIPIAIALGQHFYGDILEYAYTAHPNLMAALNRMQAAPTKSCPLYGFRYTELGSISQGVYPLRSNQLWNRGFRMLSTKT